MRGEYCIFGATALTVMAMIMLIFANIGQINPGGVCNGLYLVEMNVAAYGNAVQSAHKKSGGLYDTTNNKKTDPLGSSKGLRQYYRYGLYNACGYQKNGAGICNDTIFGYPFEPLAQLVADAPTSPDNYKQVTTAIIPDKGSGSFKNNAWNRSLSSAGSVLIFIGSLLTIGALVGGLIKHRFAFLVAAVCSGLSAFLLMVGAAIWTSIIAKDSVLQAVKVEGGVSLGIVVKVGPALGLTWAAFVFMLLSVSPYVISCCTYRK